MTSKRGSLETSITFVCRTSRLLDLSLMQINILAALFRAIGRNLYRLTLFAPCPMMLDARKNLEEIQSWAALLTGSKTLGQSRNRSTLNARRRKIQITVQSPGAGAICKRR